MRKSTLLALIVFAGLVAAAIWRTTRTEERGIDRVSLAKVDTAAIDRIELSGKTRLELRREGNSWRTSAGKAADPDAIKALLEAVPRVDSSDLMTRASDRYAEYEVDDAKGTRVRATAAGKIVVEFVAGKAMGDGMAVRVGDGIFRVARLFPYVFVREQAGWLDRRLFRDDAESVSRVEARLGGLPPFALVKSGADWAPADASALPAGFRFDKWLAAGWVSALLSAQAADVLDAAPPPETSKLDDTADLVAFDVSGKADGGDTGGRRELRLGAALADKSVYARASSRDDVVTLPEHVVKSIRKALTDFRDLTMMKLEATKVQELTIADGKVKLVFERQGASWKLSSSAEPIPKDFDLDAAAVDRRLGMLGVSRALGVAAVKPAEAGLPKPQASLVAKLEGKDTASLVFGKDLKHDESDAVYAKGNADGAVYVVAKQLRSGLTGGIETFRKRAQPMMPGGLDPNSLSNLPPEVRQAILKQLAERQNQ